MLRLDWSIHVLDSPVKPWNDGIRYLIDEVINILLSRVQAVDVDRGVFVLGLTLVLSFDGKPCNTIKIITRIFPLSADEQVLFFIDQVPAAVFSHLAVRRELNGVGRTGLLTEAAEDAPGKVDAEEFRIASSVLIFSSLKGDAVNRAYCRAEVAGHTTLFVVGVAGQDNAPPPPGRQIRPLFRIEDCFPAAKHMQKNRPYGHERIQHFISASA